MTASTIGLKEMRAKVGLRPRPHFFRRMMAIVVALEALLLALPAGIAAAAEPVKGEVVVSTDGGYARLAFRLAEEVPATVSVKFPIMVVTFKKPIAIDVGGLNAAAAGYISAARIDPDGTAIRIALVHPVKVNSIPVAERLFVDLLPENWVGVMPGLPLEVIDELTNRAREAERQLHRQQIGNKSRKPAAIRVRVAAQPTFVRYVFELPDVANVVPDTSDGKLTLNFDQPIKWDLADAKAALPATLKSVETEVDYDSTTVTFTLNGKPTCARSARTAASWSMSGSPAPSRRLPQPRRPRSLSPRLPRRRATNRRSSRRKPCRPRRKSPPISRPNPNRSKLNRQSPSRPNAEPARMNR